MEFEEVPEEYADEVARALKMMSAMANPRVVTPDLLEGWAETLWEQRVPTEQLRPIARRLLATERFFPAPADFLGAWGNVKAGERFYRKPTPEEEERARERDEKRRQEILAQLPQLQAAQRERDQIRAEREERLARTAALIAANGADPFGDAA